VEYLSLADVVQIASAVLNLGPEALLSTSRVALADSAVHAPSASFDGIEFHPGAERKIAVLGFRLIKNHPFPDGNKRVGFLAMIEMAERNGLRWVEPQDDSSGDETVGMIVGAASGKIDEDEFIIWVSSRVL
jgi:death on curing protein